MHPSTLETQTALATSVEVTEEDITVQLADGRTIVVPIGWYPRLSYGTASERNNWRFIGDGRGIHWPNLDEDISVENLLSGKPSGESQDSFKTWLDARNVSRP
jgi:hypothetical protein